MADGVLSALRSYVSPTRTVCAVAGVLFAVSVAVGQSNDTSRANDLLRSAQTEAGTNKSGAYRDARQLVDGPLFQDLDAERQHQALFLAARLAIELRHFADAHRLLRQSSEQEYAAAPDWIGRFNTAIEIEDYPDAVLALKEIAARFPDRISTFYPPLIYRALQRMRRTSGGDLAVDALELLFAGRWLDTSKREPSAAWRDLALARFERNDLPGALEAAARIASPVVLIEMRADKRFDAIVAALPAHFDIDRAVDEEIAFLQSAVAAAPNLLQSVVLQISALRDANRLDEALALADIALERATNLNRVSPYTDGREQVAWLHNARATVLWTMGRHTEAAEELKKASDSPGNVSQRINYAGLLVRLGRGAEALALVRDLENTSSYGDMQAAAVEVAAAVQVGDRRAASKPLKYLETHESDDIGALQSGLLSVRDFDAAALVFIKRLESGETRGDALVEAQNYLDAPETPHEAQLAADWTALLARPAVRSALETVGRIESHAIHKP